MKEIEKLIVIESERYEYASDDEKDAIADRIKKLAEGKAKIDTALAAEQKNLLEDTREKIRIENELLDMEERRILESEKNQIEEERNRKEMRTNLILKGVEFLGLIFRDLIGIHSDRKNMHELMRFEKSPEGYDVMTTQSSKKFFLNKKK